MTYLSPISLTAGTTSADASSNTTAINNAINTGSGNAVYLPPGTFYVNPLTMYPGTTLIGAGMGGYGPTQPNTACTTTLNLFTGAASSLINVPVSTPDVTIRDIQLNGGTHTDNPGVDVITLADASSADQTNLRLERVMILQGGRYGLYVGTKRDDVKAHHCEFMYAYSHGLFTKGPDGVYDACEFGSNGQDGTSQNIVVGAVVNRFTNNDIWSSGSAMTQTAQIGIYVETGITGIVIMGNGIDRHPKQGVYFDTGCYSNTVYGNVFHSNGQAGPNGTYAHCYAVADLAGACSFDGNVAIYDSGVTNYASYLCQGGTSGHILAGANNYAQVGGTTPGVKTAILHV